MTPYDVTGRTIIRTFVNNMDFYEMMLPTLSTFYSSEQHHYNNWDIQILDFENFYFIIYMDSQIFYQYIAGKCQQHPP